MESEVFVEEVDKLLGEGSMVVVKTVKNEEYVITGYSISDDMVSLYIIGDVEGDDLLSTVKLEDIKDVKEFWERVDEMEEGE